MKLATLGPAGTFSEQATEQFIRQQGFNSGTCIVFYSHLQRCLQAVPDEADFAVVPIENVSEGFVPVVLDQLLRADLHIVSELHLNIEFSACGHVNDKQSIKRLYVQFVARGQCREFIEGLGDIEIISTQSNTESLQLANQHGQGGAAIIPSHLMATKDYPAGLWAERQVHDYAHNQTRFLLLAAGPVPIAAQGQKTSLLVINENDRPGLLEKVLHCFSTRRLNLTSIVSRPTGQGFGRYHFFMDVQADMNNIAMQGALRAVAQIAEVKVLGCY